MIMTAIVLEVETRSLLVRDLDTGGEVRVFTGNARRFAPGENIRITYSGAMTLSIPPQITATSIQRIPAPRPPERPRPSEMRAIVLQQRRNSLLVRDISNNRQAVVSYRYAHHFCAGQRIVVQYDTIMMSNPIEVNATDIRPVC